MNDVPNSPPLPVAHNFRVGEEVLCGFEEDKRMDGKSVRTVYKIVEIWTGKNGNRVIVTCEYPDEKRGIVCRRAFHPAQLRRVTDNIFG